MPYFECVTSLAYLLGHPGPGQGKSPNFSFKNVVYHLHKYFAMENFNV